MHVETRWCFVISGWLVFVLAHSSGVHKEYTFWNATGQDVEIEIVRASAKNVQVTISAYTPQMSVSPEGPACLASGVQFRVRSKKDNKWQSITGEYQKGSYQNNCENEAWVIGLNNTGHYVFMKQADYSGYYMQYTRVMLVHALMYKDDTTVCAIYRHALEYIKNWNMFINNAPGRLTDPVKQALVCRFWAVVKQKVC